MSGIGISNIVQNFLTNPISDEGLKISSTDSSKYLIIKSADSLLNDVEYIFPESPTANHFLQTDATGTLSWVAGGVSSPVTALNNQTSNRLITIGATTTELDGEANLTFDGTTLEVTGTGIFSAGLTVKNGGTSGGFIDFYEDSDSGTNKVRIIAPSTLATDYTLTLPPNDGDVDQILKTDGSGVLSWTDNNGGGGGTITALNNQGENRLVTIGSTVTELDGEVNLTYSSNTLGMVADSASITFGADSEITLTHVADTGLTLAGSNANGTNLKINNTATDGDSRVEYQLSGNTLWSVGVEDGDGDKFVIEKGSGTLGTTPVLEIDSSGTHVIPGQIRTKNESTANYITPNIDISTGMINILPTITTNVTLSGDIQLITPDSIDITTDSSNDGFKSSNISISTGNGGNVKTKIINTVTLLGKTGYINGETVTISGGSTGAIGRVITKKISTTNNVVSKTKGIYDGNEYVTSIEIIHGGAGYTANDVLTVTGTVSNTSSQRIYVTTVDTGVITGVGLLYGDYSSSWTSGETLTDNITGSGTPMHTASITSTLGDGNAYISSVAEYGTGTPYVSNANYRNNQVITLTGSSSRTAVAYVTTTTSSDNPPSAIAYISNLVLLGKTGYTNGESVNSITNIFSSGSSVTFSFSTFSTTTYNSVEYITSDIFLDYGSGSGYAVGDILQVDGTTGTGQYIYITQVGSSGEYQNSVLVYPDASGSYTTSWNSAEVSYDNINSSTNMHKVHPVTVDSHNYLIGGTYHYRSVEENGSGDYSSNSGYTANDVITITGSSSSNTVKAVVEITANTGNTLPGGYVFTALGCTGYQNDDAFTDSDITFISGSTGAGLTGNIKTTLYSGVEHVSGINITNGGSGYVSGDVIQIDSSNGSGQRFYISFVDVGGIIGNFALQLLPPTTSNTYVSWTSGEDCTDNINSSTTMHVANITVYGSFNYINQTSSFNEKSSGVTYSANPGAYYQYDVIIISSDTTAADVYISISDVTESVPVAPDAQRGGKSGDVIINTGNGATCIDGSNSGNIYIQSGDGGDANALGIGGDSGNIYIGVGDVGTGNANGNEGVINIKGNIIPKTTETYNLGSSSYEWNNIYVQNTVTVSDSRYKKSIEPSNLGLNFIKDINPVSYVLKNNNNNNEIHYGVIAQELISVIQKNNISLDKFAGIKYDKNSKKYGVVYTEFISPLIKSVQDLDKIVEVKDTKINSLETRLNEQSALIQNLLERVSLLEQ